MKLRIGYDESEASIADFWTIVENAANEGIDALIIHGRTVSQDYHGKGQLGYSLPKLNGVFLRQL